MTGRPTCQGLCLVEGIVNALTSRPSTSFPFWRLLHRKNRQDKCAPEITFDITFNQVVILSGSGSKNRQQKCDPEITFDITFSYLVILSGSGTKNRQRKCDQKITFTSYSIKWLYYRARGQRIVNTNVTKKLQLHHIQLRGSSIGFGVKESSTQT